jgi:hypothetical protein
LVVLASLTSMNLDCPGVSIGRAKSSVRRKSRSVRKPAVSTELKKLKLPSSKAVPTLPAKLALLPLDLPTESNSSVLLQSSRQKKL